jgi:hypothetical protein
MTIAWGKDEGGRMKDEKGSKVESQKSKVKYWGGHRCEGRLVKRV